MFVPAKGGPFFLLNVILGGGGGGHVVKPRPKPKRARARHGLVVELPSGLKVSLPQGYQLRVQAKPGEQPRPKQIAEVIKERLLEEPEAVTVEVAGVGEIPALVAYPGGIPVEMLITQEDEDFFWLLVMAEA